MKRKLRVPFDALLQHLGAQDVGRHQVGRELDALGVEPEHDAHGFDQLGLGEAGNADEKRMAAGEDGQQCLLDHAFLAENDLADSVAHGENVGERLFGLGDHFLLADRACLVDAHAVSIL